MGLHAVKSSRLTFTLPPVMAADLQYLSDRMGISRGALLVQLVGHPLHQLAGMVRATPDNPDAESLRRFRGQSIDYIEQAVSDAMRELEVDSAPDVALVCTCTHTRYERMENRDCPVHPVRGRK